MCFFDRWRGQGRTVYLNGIDYEYTYQELLNKYNHQNQLRNVIFEVESGVELR